MFLSLPGSTTISTLVTAFVPVPISVSLSVSGPAISVFVSLPFPLSFPLPFPLLLPLAVPPFSLPFPLFFPFLAFPLKLQPLFLPLVLFFFEFLQSKTESGSANDTPDRGNPTITLSSAWIKWFPDLKRFHRGACTNQCPACQGSWGSNQKPWKDEWFTLRRTHEQSLGSIIYYLVPTGIVNYTTLH